jgi:glycosyltransferase involved in cell wall biosynthesis
MDPRPDRSPHDSYEGAPFLETVLETGRPGPRHRSAAPRSGDAAAPGLPRICVVCFPYAPTLAPDRPRGIDRYLQELISSLRARGVPVEPVGAARPFGPADRLISDAAGCLLQVGSVRASIYHAADPLGAAFLLLFRKRPLVVTVHDTVPFGPTSVLGASRKPLRFLVWRTLVRACLRMADAIIVPFPATAADLVQMRPSARDRIHTIPYGISVPAGWPPGAASRRGSEEPSILFMGGTQPVIRGGLLCLRMMARLHHEGVRVRLTFVAGGTEMAQIRTTCRELGLEDRVDFRPLVPDAQLLPFVAAFDALVYPTPLGFSYILLQAMVAGTPVVTTRCRDLPDFVEGYGVLCPPDDVASFTEAVRRIVTDPTYHDELAARGRTRAAEFRSERMTDRVVDVYRSIGVPIPEANGGAVAVHE